MQLHFNGVVSDVFELWGGGPQGGLLTILLFNVNSNWLTDVCFPSIPQSNRFSKSLVPISVPRNAFQQLRDCPPEVLPPFESFGFHDCPYSPKCSHAKPASPTGPESPDKNSFDVESAMTAARVLAAGGISILSY